MAGIAVDVLGVISEIIIRTMVYPSKTVMAKPIFSPESEGRRNTKTVRIDISIEGITTVHTKNSGLRLQNRASNVRSVIALPGDGNIIALLLSKLGIIVLS